MNIVAQKLSLGFGALKVMIKDSINIQGFKTLSGSHAFDDSQPAEKNAVIIDNILKSDCEITGKTNLHELAFGITGINKNFGTPLNPKYPKLIPGGSSSGSAAAIAAHLADFSIGTDTGGSVRMPAACCGVFGLKPTFGRVSHEGVCPEQSSLDCVGPFANSVEMIAIAMQIIDPTFKPAPLLEVAPKLACLDVPAESAVWQTIHHFLDTSNLATDKVHLENFEAAYDAGMQIINYENWQAYGHLTTTGKVGQDVNERLLKAAHTTFAQVENAEKIRSALTKDIDQLLEHYDALILPTLPSLPPHVADAENTVAFLNLTAFVRPFNLSGHPAISIPLETVDGLPVGLQIVTKRHSDEQLCAISQFIVNAAEHTKKGVKS
ncbi:amidase [Acinetobacter sp.]|uniref:amidase n=1 Tax=Acinetobacter sp. TaxID=472 RepID=UPI003890F907